MKERIHKRSVKQFALCVLWVLLALIMMIASAEIASTAVAETPGGEAEIVALSAEEIVAESEIVPAVEEIVETDDDEEELAAAEAEPELTEAQELAARAFAGLIVDFIRFNIDNVDASVVETATFFSGYDGQLVFFGDWESGRSGSFGRLMGVHILSKGTRYFSELLKHEHGHYEQFLEIGLLKYIFAIAIPSITNEPADYYSQPWEVTADLLGGVTTHHHAPGSEEAGIAYLNNVKNADLLSVILGKTMG